MIAAGLTAVFLPLAVFAASIGVAPSSGADGNVTFTPGSADTLVISNDDATPRSNSSLFESCTLPSDDTVGNLLANCGGENVADWDGATLNFYICNSGFAGQDSECSDNSDPDFATASFTVNLGLLVANYIHISPDFAPALGSNVSDQMSDQGTLLLLGVVIGIPLAFFIFHELLNLLPGMREYRKKHDIF